MGSDEAKQGAGSTAGGLRGGHQTNVGDMDREDLESRGWHGEHEGASEEVKEGYKKAWEGRDTAESSKGPDQGTTDAEAAAQQQMASMEAPGHVEGLPKGEEQVESTGKEPGRYDAGTKGIETERPVGKSTARDATKIDPQEPIDEESPTIPPGTGAGN